MPALSRSRISLALLALSLGGFGIGTTEFVAMGLLPELARDLLPALYASDPEDAIGRSGAIVSAYALGVVVGAPTIAVLAARLPRRGLLLGCVAAFALGSLASALAPGFEALVAARFLAALGHGAYFGVGALVAASLMGPGSRGKGVALVLTGLTVANVVGVPAVSWLGQAAGWRAAYLAIAAIFALAGLAILLAVPAQPGDRSATVRRELSAFGRGRVWLALLTGALGTGGFFAVYSYVAPLATEVTGLDPGLVPVALVVVGLGMTAGNLVAGRIVDRGVLRATLGSFAAFAASLLLIALAAAHPVGLFAGLFFFAAAGSTLVPAIQLRLMDVAGDSQTLAAAGNHASLNLGNALGAALGGAVIAAQWGYLAPVWVGLALCVPGVLLALAGRAADRRPGARPLAGDGGPSGGPETAPVPLPAC